MDFTKPLSELTPAEVAQEMAALAQRNAELDAEQAETARTIERLKAQPSIGIYDPNASPDKASPDKPSSEVVALVKHLLDIELTQKQERHCAAIQQLFSVILRPQLEAEMMALRLTDQVRADWATFRARCKEVELPHLPAPPEALLLAIADDDAATAQRLANSVSLVHRNLGEADPCDALVRAALRCKREEAAANEVKQDEKGN